MKNRMFEFITCTWNPLGGACHYNCSYCWARKLSERYGHKKYMGEARLIEGEFKRKFKPGSFVFVQDMSDLFGCWVKDEDILRVFDYVRSNPDVEFLFLTKNPTRYLSFVSVLPANAVLGATVESDVYRPDVSGAPDPQQRLTAMSVLSGLVSNRLFVSVEPVMGFTFRFAEELLRCKLWAVAVGYDNFRCGLEEPLLAFTFKLICELEKAGVRVYRKSLRPSRRERCFGRRFGGYNHCIACDLQEKCKEKQGDVGV